MAAYQEAHTKLLEARKKMFFEGKSWREGKAELTGEEKKAAKELSRARGRIISAHKQDAKKFKKMSKAERAALRAKLRKFSAKLKKDREERAEAERKRIREGWAKRYRFRPVQFELRMHAWRVARLERLAAISEAAEREAAAEKAKMLLEKENERHEKRMAELKAMRIEKLEELSKSAPGAEAPAAGDKPAAKKPVPSAPIKKPVAAPTPPPTPPSPPTTPTPPQGAAQ